MEQLELLCVRPATVSAAPDMSFTGCVSIHKDKPHRRKPVFAVLRFILDDVGGNVGRSARRRGCRTSNCALQPADSQ